MRKKIDYKHLIEDVCGFKFNENDVTHSRPLLSMTAQQALNELCYYFLGDNWYESTGQTQPKVVNFSIVEEIESRYRGVNIKKRKK